MSHHHIRSYGVLRELFKTKSGERDIFGSAGTSRKYKSLESDTNDRSLEFFDFLVGHLSVSMKFGMVGHTPAKLMVLLSLHVFRICT
jgi:hypothetical protein